MSDIDIAALRRLLAEASPGPWEYDGVPVDDSHWTVAEIARGAPLPMIEVPGSEAKDANADAALIVALRNAASELLDRLERAERKLESAREATESVRHVFDEVGVGDVRGTILRVASYAIAKLDGDSKPE